MGGAYISPSKDRIEEACGPFDKDNSSDMKVFAPSQVGWLRVTKRYRAPGTETGGLYLVRSGVKAEKLVDTFVESWNLSPDGCQLAFAHRADGNS